MGLSLNDASLIELDTYLELVDLFKKEHDVSSGGAVKKVASQSDIDKFLL